MSSQSKVGSIIDSLRNRILTGEFGEGRLPSFRKLVVEYETSQETMNKAMQTLQAEGLLVSAGAKGVFTNVNRMRVPGLGRVKNFFDYMQQQGFDAFEETIGEPQVITPSKEMSKAMHLAKNEKVLFRLRRQGTKLTPFRLVEGYYPMSLITDSMLEQIKTDQHYYIIGNIQQNFKKSIKHIHEEIITRLPTIFEQEQLEIVRTNPVIEVTFINYDEDKKTVIMYNKMILNANHFLLSYDYEVGHWA